MNVNTLCNKQHMCAKCYEHAKFEYIGLEDIASRAVFQKSYDFIKKYIFLIHTILEDVNISCNIVKDHFKVFGLKLLGKQEQI